MPAGWGCGEDLEWEEVRGAFHPDGSLRDIYVPEADAARWDRFLAALPGWDYALAYLEEGIEAPYPSSFRSLYSRRDEAGPLLAIDLGGVLLLCHFFREDEVELDLDPREVRGEREFRLVMGFMARLGALLGRRVILTEESTPSSVIFSYDPNSQTIRHHPDGYAPQSE